MTWTRQDSIDETKTNIEHLKYLVENGMTGYCNSVLEVKALLAQEYIHLLNLLIQTDHQETRGSADN